MSRLCGALFVLAVIALALAMAWRADRNIDASWRLETTQGR